MTTTNPVDTVIEELGGVAAVASVCDVSEEAVYNWRHRGIPDRQKYRIDRHVRGSGMPAARFKRILAALDAPWPPGDDSSNAPAELADA